jgi:hypothetical protein
MSICSSNGEKEDFYYFKTDVAEKYRHWSKSQRGTTLGELTNIRVIGKRYSKLKI